MSEREYVAPATLFFGQWAKCSFSRRHIKTWSRYSRENGPSTGADSVLHVSYVGGSVLHVSYLVGGVLHMSYFVGSVLHMSYLVGSVLHMSYLVGSVLHMSYLGGSRVETLWSGARGVVTQTFAWAEGVTGTGNGVHSCISRT